MSEWEPVCIAMEYEELVMSSRQTNDVAKSMLFRWNLLRIRCPCYCLRCLAGSGCYRFPSRAKSSGWKPCNSWTSSLASLACVWLHSLVTSWMQSRRLSPTLAQNAKKEFCEQERLESSRFWRGGPMSQCFCCSCTFRKRGIGLRCQLDGGFLQGRATFLAVR